MVFNSDVFYLRLTLDNFNGIRSCAFAMVDEQTNFYNVWDFIQRNLCSLTTALGLHDSAGIPSPFTQITLFHTNFLYFTFLVSILNQYSYLSKAKTPGFTDGQMNGIIRYLN